LTSAVDRLDLRLAGLGRAAIEPEALGVAREPPRLMGAEGGLFGEAALKPPATADCWRPSTCSPSARPPEERPITTRAARVSLSV
jgi:hypothetical protein